MILMDEMKENVELVFDWHKKVSIKSHCKFEVAENDNYVVLLDGSLRHYGISDEAHIDGSAILLGLLSECENDYYEKLAGFFNAVIFDKRRNKIKLISDHIGSKALYYTFQQNTLMISDSLNLLDTAHLTLNPQGIFNYCFYHCIAAPTTIYKEAFKLEAGQCVEQGADGELTSQLLYQPDYNYSNDDDKILHKECRTLIAQAVIRGVGDDCGAFLSGGLDSSTVAGMLAKNAAPAKTFSIGFESKQYDESGYAKLASQHFDTLHHCHVMQPEELIKNFKQVARYFDQPFGNSSAMAAYCCALFAKSHGVTTLLAGDGGDEIFAGNERYAKQATFEQFNKAPKMLQGLMEAMFCKTPLGTLPIGSKAKSYIEQAKVELPDRLDSYNFLNRFALEDMFTASFLAQVDPQQPVVQKRERYGQAKSASHLEKMLFLDWKFTLADNDLVKVSTMCEMAGVKVKYPLLEKELVDFSCRIKDDDKLKGNHLRYFFKNAMKGFLPDDTLTKEKHGFGLPFGLWMTQSDDLMAIAKEALSSLAQRDIFKPEFIELAIDKHQSEHSSYYGELIWILIVLELWLESRGF